VTRQRHTAYAGVISTTVSVRTDTTTTITNGFDFRAFTPSEWYQENKGVLKQYHIPISQVKNYYEPKDAYKKTISTSRSITSTEKIMSRNDNNDYKNGIISQGLKVAGVSDKIVGIGKGMRNDESELMYNPYLEWYEPTEYTEDYTYWDALGDRVIVNLGLPVLDAKIADSGKTPFGRVLTDEEKQLLYEKNKENWIDTIILLAVSGGKGKGKIEPPKTTVKGFRYVSEGEYNVIKKTGVIPNTDRSGNLKDMFISPIKYDTVAGAEKGLQIGTQNPNGATSSPMYRVEFDMNGIKFRYGGNVEGGTGVELITEQPIPIDLIKIFKLR